MTAHILVVDDEPDIERLILQKFRSQIWQGVVALSFVRDGFEALNALLESNRSEAFNLTPCCVLEEAACVFGNPLDGDAWGH
jgi:CheY-like chemotaxis protein